MIRKILLSALAALLALPALAYEPPPGTNGQIPYNHNGIYGAFTPGGDVTFAPSTGAFTVNGSQGDPFGSAAFENIGFFAQAANNGSDFANKATTRSNLGLTIGTTVEAWSANLDIAAGAEFTGSGGAIVRATGPTINSPTLVTPALGTPASGNASNLTSIPVNNPLTGSVLPWLNGPIQSFSNGTYGSKTVENVTISGAGAVETLLNASPGTPGYIDSINIVGSSQGQLFDSVIKIYIDGESSPSITSDIGNLCLLGGFTAIAGNFSTTHIQTSFQWNTYGECAVRYPIPFHSSAIVTLTNIDSGNLQMWTTVHYLYGMQTAVPWKLWSSSVTGINAQSYTPTQQGNGTVQFLNLASGTGFVAAFNLSTTGATDYTYLENNPVMYLHGETPGTGVFPDYNSSGTEDFFLSAYYFFNGTFSSPFAMLTQKGGFQDSVAVGLDLLAYKNGVPFTNGILMRWETGQAAIPGTPDTNVKASWCVLYYMPN